MRDLRMIGQTNAATAADAPLQAPEPASTQAVGDTIQVGELADQPPQREIGGRDGPDPTRYGDWEKNGRCIDF